MALARLLHVRLGRHRWNSYAPNDMRCGVVLEKFCERAGTTPPSVARALRTRWSFPPVPLQARSAKQTELDSYGISKRFNLDPEVVPHDHFSGVTMMKFKIEKGVSRIARVKLQAAIEESVALDIALLCEWSNNEKNYVVNQLLRFALSQDAEFQRYKQSLGQRESETVTPLKGSDSLTAQSPIRQDRVITESRAASEK